jgi:hypothetical protein
MQKALIVVLVVAGWLTGCQKSSAPSASAPAAGASSAAASKGDPVDQKLQELAGSGANNCGRVPGNGDVSGASNCAMQASQGKRPFYVAYEMPGLVVGIAGANDGKLYSVQAEAPEAGAAGAQPGGQAAAKVTSMPCPAELRVAQSGRVTCMPVGAGMGSSGSPHGGGMPGGGMMAAPPGTPNPHGAVPTKPGTENPHGGGAATPLKRSSDK